jgi:hypothetical protein
LRASLAAIKEISANARLFLRQFSPRLDPSGVLSHLCIAKPRKNVEESNKSTLAMAFTNPLPPFVLHPSSTRPVHINSAHSVLRTFLHLASIDPAYCPDSTLTSRGLASNSSSTNPNLTLHHLQRIKLGLEGTHLGVEDLDATFLTDEPEDAAGHDSRGKKRRRQEGDGEGQTDISNTVSSPEGDVDVDETVRGDSVGPAANVEADSGWQDRGDFERDQDDEEVYMYEDHGNPTSAYNAEVETGILEGETGRMIDVEEELGKENGAVRYIRTGDAIDAHRAERKRKKKRKAEAEEDERKGETVPDGMRNQAVGGGEKDENRKSKKAKTSQEIPSAGNEQAREAMTTLSHTPNGGTQESKDTAPKRRKKKSKVIEGS